MSHDLLKQSAAAYALGVLDGIERDAFEAHLGEGCAECAAEVRAMGGTATLLAFAPPPALPSPRLKRRVLSAIGDDTFYYLRSDESEWEATEIQGLDLRRLFIDTSGSGETLLVRLLPRVAYRGLPGFGYESGYVLDGALEIDGQRLARGDYFGVGAEGPERVSPQGCLLLARASASGPATVAPAIVLATAGRWRDVAPGTSMRSVFLDRARGFHTLLMRMAPGADFVDHVHSAAEEIYVLEGDCRCQGVAVGPGDYHRAGAGSQHAVTSTTHGCTMIILDHNLPHAA